MSRILLVGDPMIDRHWFCSAKGISPEAPIVNWVVDRMEDNLGGAANVLANLCSLSRIYDDDVEVIFAGCIPSEITTVLNENGFCNNYRSFDGNRAPTIKNRIVDLDVHGHRVRFDQDYKKPPEEDKQENLIEWIKSQDKFDVAVISDYNHGQVTRELIDTVIENSFISVADPKGLDRDKYKGVTIITPNITETEKLIPEEPTPVLRAIELSKHTESKIVQKLGRDGGVLIDKDQRHDFLAFSEPGALIDPTGAGDTFISMLAFKLATGETLLSSVESANKMAGVSVTYIGCYIPLPGDVSKWNL